MGIAKLGARLFGMFGKTVGNGKLLGKSQNGIEVFQKVSRNGTKVTTSYKDGKLLKTITKSPLKESYLNTYNPHIDVGHKTLVKNHETGLSTYIKKVDADYKKQYSQYDTVFKPGVRQEFSAYKVTDDNVIVGKAYRYVSSPNFFTSERVARYKNGLPFYDATKNSYLQSGNTDKIISVVDYKLPNGAKVTGEFARRKYTDPITNTVKTRGLYYYGGREIAVTQNAKGENIVKAGYSVIN